MAVINSMDLMKEAERYMLNNATSNALSILNGLKAERLKLRNLDLFRAKCFLLEKQNIAAVQALLEELRYFPENIEARSMLNEISKPLQPTSASVDAEFVALLKIIQPYTMVGTKRLENLYQQSRAICENKIPGNFVECGVAAGGTTGLLAYVNKKFSTIPRKIFAFDSFDGMPNPTTEDVHNGMSANDSGWGAGTCSAPESSVLALLEKLECEDSVTIVKGLFSDTLPIHRESIGDIAFLHMDGDWYESTQSILNHLYGGVVSNGIVQVDDYGYWQGCKQAIHEWETNNDVTLDLMPIDGTGVWFVKK